MADLMEDFARAFRAFDNRNHPGWNWSAHWEERYRTLTIAGVRRPQLSAFQERYLEAMGFDEGSPILDPIARRWKEGEIEVEKGWNASMVNTLNAMRAYIMGYRILSGIAESESQSKSHEFLLVYDDRSDFGRLNKKSAYAFCLVDDSEWASLSFDDRPRRAGRAAIDEVGKTIVVAVDDVSMVKAVDENVGTLVRDKGAPEYGYKYKIFITHPYPSFKYDMEALCRLDSSIPLQVVCVGGGAAFNARLNQRLQARPLTTSRKAIRAVNDVEILPEPYRSRELQRYEVHIKRKKLTKVVQGRREESVKRRDL